MKPLLPILLGLILGALTVWQRAAIVHTGAELSALRAKQVLLAEEQKGLRVGLARLTSSRQLAGGTAAAKAPWVFEDAKTREVIEHARIPRQPAAGPRR